MYSRREFIKQQSLTGLAIALGPSVFCNEANPAERIQVISPVDGDLLHKQDGRVQEGSLQIMVAVAAPANSRITINNIPAKRSRGLFAAPVSLHGYQNTIEAVDTQTGEKKNITVFWPDNLEGRYRLSIDDAIWFLKDINANETHYQSIFDNPFLGLLNQLHKKYGTKIHINIFYETDGFDLSQMTDKFRNEWRANAGWLQLSFHAKAELPDDPYKKAGYDQVKKECDDVIRQIRRFAGDELVSSVTTLHWGETPVEVSRALRDCGYTVQVCDFNVDDNLPPCSYYLDVKQRRHINKRFLWKDTRENITFLKSSIIIDSKKLPEIIPYLNRYQKQLRKPPYADLLVHEQYFYKEYHNYQADYRVKVETCIKWAVENGYHPAFLKECIQA